MNSVRWVEDCCIQAIADCNRIRIEAAATSERTVADWNLLLKANREHFPLTDPKIHKHKKPLPDLLEYFREEVTLPWIDYCIGNFAGLTVEQARNELITKIIPIAALSSTTSASTNHNVSHESKNNTMIEVDEGIEETRKSKMQYQTIKHCLLQLYLGLPISLTTTWQWLRRLGFHYDNRKKSFLLMGTRDQMSSSIEEMTFVQSIFPSLSLGHTDGSRKKLLKSGSQKGEFWNILNKQSEDTHTKNRTPARKWSSSTLMTSTCCKILRWKWALVYMVEI